MTTTDEPGDVTMPLIIPTPPDPPEFEPVDMTEYTLAQPLACYRLVLGAPQSHLVILSAGTQVWWIARGKHSGRWYLQRGGLAYQAEEAPVTTEPYPSREIEYK